MLARSAARRRRGDCCAGAMGGGDARHVVALAHLNIKAAGACGRRPQKRWRTGNNNGWHNVCAAAARQRASGDQRLAAKREQRGAWLRSAKEQTDGDVWRAGSGVADGRAAMTAAWRRRWDLRTTCLHCVPFSLHTAPHRLFYTRTCA